MLKFEFRKSDEMRINRIVSSLTHSANTFRSVRKELEMVIISGVGISVEIRIPRR